MCRSICLYNAWSYFTSFKDYIKWRTVDCWPSRNENIENWLSGSKPGPLLTVVTLWGNTMKIDDKSGQVVCRNFVQTKLMFPLSSRVGIHVSSSYPDRAGCGGGGGGGGDQVWFLSGAAAARHRARGNVLSRSSAAPQFPSCGQLPAAAAWRWPTAAVTPLHRPAADYCTRSKSLMLPI